MKNDPIMSRPCKWAGRARLLGAGASRRLRGRHCRAPVGPRGSCCDFQFIIGTGRPQRAASERRSRSGAAGKVCGAESTGQHLMTCARRIDQKAARHWPASISGGPRGSASRAAGRPLDFGRNSARRKWPVCVCARALAGRRRISARGEIWRRTRRKRRSQYCARVACPLETVCCIL